MDEQAVRMEGVSIGWSVNCTGPSLNLIKRNVPQSNITEANKGKVVNVFGNEEKKSAAVPGEASVLLPVLPAPLTFLLEKLRLSPAKNFNSLCVCDEKKSPRRSALLTESSAFPQKTASVLTRDGHDSLTLN